MTVSGPASYLAELKFGSYDREFRLAELEAREDELKFSHPMNLMFWQFVDFVSRLEPANLRTAWSVKRGGADGGHRPFSFVLRPKRPARPGGDGLREPEASARALLRVIDREPYAVERALTA